MTEQRDFETIVIGAGVSGIYQIKRLVDLGIDAILLEGDDDLGGTWYRNRYPGARFDSESYTYGYSFSREVLDEWHWKERFSPQPENLRYLNFVADKFGLRAHMRFNAQVERMDWSEPDRTWTLKLVNGETYRARFVITTIGVLSVPTLPRYPGMDEFEGEAFHTFWWPMDEVPLAGKKVGVIGTGATGIQVIAEIADKVGELKVFQRRPNWSTPLNNSPISADEMAEIRSRYDEIFANCAASPNNFEHVPDRRGFWNLTHEERVAFWDELYDKPGFALLAGNFPEIFLDERANREISDYIADRIRGRVDDPELAEKLIPKDHGFGMQRLPLETKYFEAYNRDNVHLVDLSETPGEPGERCRGCTLRSTSKRTTATTFTWFTWCLRQVNQVNVVAVVRFEVLRFQRQALHTKTMIFRDQLFGQFGIINAATDTVGDVVRNLPVGPLVEEYLGEVPGEQRETGFVIKLVPEGNPFLMGQVPESPPVRYVLKVVGRRRAVGKNLVVPRTDLRHFVSRDG